MEERRMSHTPVARSVLSAILVVSVLAAFPLTGYGSGARSPAQVSGGVLRMADEGVQDLHTVDLDPPAENLGANAIFVISLVFGGLVRLDDKLAIAPDGASSWTLSKDKRTYTFHIRPGLKFADGTSVTAADFAWSLNRAFSPQFANGNTDYYLSHIVGGPNVTNKRATKIKGVKVVNSSTLRITVDVPTAAFLDQLAFSASFVVPQRIIQKYGKHWTEHAVGTGPFYVKRWQHNKEIDLAPNPYYWRGKAKVSMIRILFIQNPDTAYNLYRTGGLDVMGAIQFPSDKLTGAEKQPGFHQVPQLFTEYIPPNEKKKPFDNVHVRRAFSMAIDRAILVNKFLGGQYVPAKGILPPGIPGYNSGLQGQTFDPKQAKAELALGGYPNGKGLPPITLSFSGGDPGQKDSAQVLQQMWKQTLGVTVSLNQLEAGAYNNALTARNFQLAFISWGADYPDPQNFLSLQLQTGAGNNNGSFSDSAFDQLTKRADTIVGNNRYRYRLYQQAEKIALDKAAWICLFHGKSAILINNHVHGLVINGGGLTARNWAGVTVQ
jgi:oligopeptide transport system substrate-binding protein